MLPTIAATEHHAALKRHYTLFYVDNTKYFPKFKTTGKKHQELRYQIPIYWL